MLPRQKQWFMGGVWKPKNPHSLEHLKYLHTVLCKNQTVTEQNRALLVETLRSISEILIWGDQNDGTVFDFFLEKNMLSFFLQFMRQKYGRFICTQLLQTLNILFDNISNETSVYYLLSNNLVNSIIVHKFDFSDEEVMAYYISFLKTLSLRLNSHTIHFFYNEHTNDFPLYTEGIKFFNHSETMVRIAVRTITLNVYKVMDKSMLRFIRDKTAAPYFSNLVWFIGNNVLDLDLCVRHDRDHNSRGRLSDLVAEHLDHIHYVNDILNLNIDALNEVLTDHLLNNLLLPLYVFSLQKRNKYELRSLEKPHISHVVSLFLLSQVFLILTHKPLVRQLAEIIFHGDFSIFSAEGQTPSPQLERRIRGFVKPSESLAKTLDKAQGKGGRPVRRPNYRNVDEPETDTSHSAGNSTFYGTRTLLPDEENEDGNEEHNVLNEEESSDKDEVESNKDGGPVEPVEVKATESDTESLKSDDLNFKNVTDDEKILAHQSSNTDSCDEASSSSSTVRGPVVPDHSAEEFTLESRPYMQAIFTGLECVESDYQTLFSLCLLYALAHNDGINQEVLDTVQIPKDQCEDKSFYNVHLVESLIKIISRSCQSNNKVRIATLELTIKFLKSLILKEKVKSFLQDGHLAAIEGAREEATLLLRNFYKVWEKSEEIFLDMFEDEHREMKTRSLNVEYLMMDASILLPPTGTPLTGIDFIKRLPCGEVERARKAIRVFFYVRDLSVTLRQEIEKELPLTKEEECVKLGDVLDLNNSDLIACTVVNKENKRERRFLVIDVLQLILVEPDSRKLGWGLVKFVGFLQDVEVVGDKEDSRSLHITIHKPSMNVHAKPLPLLSAKFMFDDHIRCMAAKQRLTKGRLKARQRKMQMIARLLELPAHIVESMYQAPTGSIAQSAIALKTRPGMSSGSNAHPGRSHQVTIRTKSQHVKGSGSKLRSGSNKNLAEQNPKAKDQPSPQAMSRGSMDVEEAVEATPQSALGKADLPVGKEVPFEDISKKADKLLSGTRQLFQGSRSGKSAGSAKSETERASESPKRRGRSLSGSGNSSPTNRSRESSRSSVSSSSRAEPSSSPEREASRDKEMQDVSSDCISAIDINSDSPPDIQRQRSLSSDSAGATCPKTLTPAQTPALSLVTSCDVSMTSTLNMPSIGSPKLVPPAEPGARFSEGDISFNSSNFSTSIDEEETKNCESLKERVSSASIPVPSASQPMNSSAKFSPVLSKTPPTLGETSILADLSKIERVTDVEGSATTQLTKLAQMVHEHYSSFGEEGADVIELKESEVSIDGENDQHDTEDGTNTDDK